MAERRPRLRFITEAKDMTVVRLWPFQDLMATRGDLEYSVHLLGDYRADPALVSNRLYVDRKLPSPASASDVWLMRGWNTPQLVVAAFLARARGLPLMLWHEPPGKTQASHTFKQRARARSRELLLPLIFRAYQGCVMLGIGELATRRFAELAPGSRVHLLPYPDDRADALLARGLGRTNPRTRRVPRLVFVGQFLHRKGLDVLVAACEELWRDGLEFEMRYVGKGAMEHVLQEHATRSHGQAHILGPRYGDDLLDVFEDADGLVLPSRWDGWGLVVHEALAAGLPVVVTDACGASMLVRDNQCGAVVKSGDSASLADGLRWCILLSDAERDEIRRRGQSAAGALTMDRIADRLVQHVNEAYSVAS